MPTTQSKPTHAELDQAKRLYNDVNCYLEYLTDIIQSEVQELQEDEDSDDEELSPTVFQFLKDYKEYVSSQPQVHAQLLDSDNPSTSASISSRLRKRFWRYSQTYQTLQLLSPDILCDQKSCETKLDCSVQVSPLFSTSLPNINGANEKLLTNEASPSVALLKAQLDKNAKEQEKNCIIIRQPRYPLAEEKSLVFVVKKSPAAIVAPPTIVEPPKRPQEPIKEEIKDEKSEVLSEKKTKKSIDFLSSFLAITKVGFSRSQLSQLVWT